MKVHDIKIDSNRQNKFGIDIAPGQIFDANGHITPLQEIYSQDETNQSRLAKMKHKSPIWAKNAIKGGSFVPKAVAL